nr:hypothetical protein CFP56_19797 [Quercus suber]
MFYNSDEAKCCSPPDGLVVSVLHFASLTPVHLLSKPGFARPSPQDLEVLLLRRPSLDRNFISNEGEYILVTINANLSSNSTESVLLADIDTISWGKKINLEDFEERINEIDQEIRNFDISSKTVSVTQDSTTSTSTGDINPSKSTTGNPRPSKTGLLQDVTNVRLGQQGEKLTK